METNFIHLRLHTEYSLSDGIIQLSSLMEKAVAYHMPAVGITDLNNMYATIKFYQAAMEAGIKPIVGVDVHVTNDKNPKEYFKLTLFCQNNQGYQHLLKLISRSYLEGQTSGAPFIQQSWLAPFADGLIALSGAEEGDIGQALLANDKNTAASCLRYWQSLFPNRFYIEISRTGKAKKRIQHICFYN